MLKKSTIIKAAAAVFCTGVLLGGIGTGVAIAEYSSLEYTGEHFLGEENIKTENLDVEVVPDGDKKIQIQRRYGVSNIHYGEEIPMDTIRYVVTYNTELLKIWAEYDEYDEYDQDEHKGDSRYQGSVRLDYYYVGNEFDLFMRNKDKILEELKNGQVGSYRTESIKSVEVWANPEMKPYIEF